MTGKLWEFCYGKPVGTLPSNAAGL